MSSAVFCTAGAHPTSGVPDSSFYNGIPIDGWSRLHIQTNPSYDPSLQSRAAGYLEGALTHFLMWNAYDVSAIGTSFVIFDDTRRLIGCKNGART